MKNFARIMIIIVFLTINTNNYAKQQKPRLEQRRGNFAICNYYNRANTMVNILTSQQGDDILNSMMDKIGVWKTIFLYTGRYNNYFGLSYFRIRKECLR